MPSIVPAPAPLTLPFNPDQLTGNVSTLGSDTGNYVEPSLCLSEYSNIQPPLPYGPANANQNLSLVVEEGFKQLRGKLSEGRFLTFEVADLALTNLEGMVADITPASANHESISQRWIIHSTGAPDTFYIQSALDKTYISSFPALGSLNADVNAAQAFTVSYTPNGATYSLTPTGNTGKFIGVMSSSVDWAATEAGQFNVFSVSYYN
jgi:phospholipase C